jgi:alpha-D-ribose 1-methylphosphonate 5-triphosphate synthase subunit PhnL
MTYVKVENELLADEPGPKYVVFRQHVVDVVNEVLALLKAGECVLVTGSPGVGKSASLLPYLVRELVRVVLGNLNHRASSSSTIRAVAAW